MKRIFCLAIISMFFFLPAFSLSDRTISVTGNGIVQTEPDLANVRFGVDVIGKTAIEAQSTNAAIMHKVFNAISRLGIAKENIQTSGYNIYPDTRYENNQPPKIVGYRCANQVDIRLENLAKVSSIIDAGISAGANNVQSVTFSKKDDSKVRGQALEKAVKEAIDKAKTIASASGLKLKEIKNIIESGSIIPLSINTADTARAMGVGGGGPDTPVSAGLIEVRGNVTIIYNAE